jgi:hypothetical protein
MHPELRATTGKPEFMGADASRTLKTQEQNKTYALLQQTMTQEGGVYTLTFGVSRIGVPFLALVTLKTSEVGNTVIRQFHVVKGTTITISVQDVTPTILPVSGDPTPGAGTEYTVSVVVERGTRASDNLPTLWAGCFALTDSGGATPSVTVDIPQDSGVISAEVCALSAANAPAEVVVEFLGGGTGIFKAYRVIDKPGFVMIPPGATQIIIANLDAANAAEVTLTWGIDG